MRILIAMMIALLLASTANSGDFSLKSNAFTNKSKIPDLYTCNGKNISPELFWTDPPANTQSFTLILSSSDSPWGMIYLWILYNIPASLKMLTEGADNLPDSVSVGMNSMQESNYRGPCPPDDKIHNYIFTLYALDNTLNLPDEADPADVLAKMKRHIIDQAQLSGSFSH